ncbi:PadR family transcriptional regulator [Companilactobacillus nuruki]|uniref:Transcriptional regulator n=1 Tax=Companilactobacillus nuruki TaxID=1993540 RepID=A0A2N7AXK6_9LACO|nr:helix-turn-helix transcriptional regulator [Companilactobacillus nuruki]PMD73828.1 transcriptional regulator [Companilactobacillus nuruki]
MNELFILGELMESPQNGYHLRSSLQVSLGRNRKISFGVLYPLLDKLEKNGLIKLKVLDKGRTQKIATITDKGRQRFFDLMKEDVPVGARSQDIYLIKLDAMQHLSLMEQKDLLMNFIREQQKTIDEERLLIEKFSIDMKKDHWYAEKKQELKLAEAKVAIDWANKFLNDLPYDETN